MDICLSPARAAASRRNGARSRGPKTPAGKARSAQNALKHGMRAQQCIVLPGERAAAFEAFAAALLADLAPQGALQTVLAQRIVAASWRLARAERLEAELFCEARLDDASPGLALALAVIRDGRGAGAFATLLRYRGSASAELWRALRTLKALQAEATKEAPPARARARGEAVPERALGALPNQPETRTNPRGARTEPASTPASPAPGPVGARLTPSPAVGAPDGAARGPNPFPALAPATPSAKTAPAADGASVVRHAPSNACAASAEMPIEPEARTKPGEATGFDAGGPAALGLKGGDMVGF
jgi:hypothetical protein